MKKYCIFLFRARRQGVFLDICSASRNTSLGFSYLMPRLHKWASSFTTLENAQSKNERNVYVLENPAAKINVNSQQLE